MWFRSNIGVNPGGQPYYHFHDWNRHSTGIIPGLLLENIGYTDEDWAEGNKEILIDAEKGVPWLRDGSLTDWAPQTAWTRSHSNLVIYEPTEVKKLLDELSFLYKFAINFNSEGKIKYDNFEKDYGVP